MSPAPKITVKYGVRWFTIFEGDFKLVFYGPQYGGEVVDPGWMSRTLPRNWIVV